MANRSGATYYCPACDREGAATNRYHHEKGKRHRAAVERKFPRPDLPPVDPLTLTRAINFSRGKLAHLGYLDHPSKSKA